MKGDEVLKVKLFNHLGLNAGETIFDLWPDVAYFLAGGPNGTKLGYNYEGEKERKRPDWRLGEHINGIHSIHTTNMHTHGLHVYPGELIDVGDPEQIHSDNIYLRVIPRADYDKRVEENVTFPPIEGEPRTDDHLLEGEEIAFSKFHFKLGKTAGEGVPIHPPGTHWYHPHAHGATNMQVASGMAGFLVIEGDVDEAINSYMTDEANPDTTFKTGKWEYRERMMFIQRVTFPAVDQDSKRPNIKKAATPSVNGSIDTKTITMQPGAVERWRFLNGSVDGQGYVRFMVLRGQWIHATPPTGTAYISYEDGQVKICQRPSAARPQMRKLIDATKQLIYVNDEGTYYLPSTSFIEYSKVTIHQLAKDGVTLVNEEGQYTLKDLSKSPYKNPLYQDFSNIEAAYASAENLKAVYNLPNELYMAPANRADFMFQAPSETGVYTVLAKGTDIDSENLERNIQVIDHYLNEDGTPPSWFGGLNFPDDTVVANLIVKPDSALQQIKKDQGLPILPPAFDFGQLKNAIAKVPVPEQLKPIPESELKINTGKDEGKYRTRVVTYSGWGAANWPTLYPNDVKKCDPKGVDPKVNPNLIWNPFQFGVPKESPDKEDAVVAPSITKTMGIDGKKFNPDDKKAPRPLLDTAEEWVVENQTISLFAKLPDISNISGDNANNLKFFTVEHRESYAITRNEAKKQGFHISTRGVDHPFHIHTNPFWLMRVEVPDADGNLVNILPEPIWQDVIWIPRNAGRVVFRSRFPDFTGKMVNHCHILQHEDNGMMQEVKIVADPADANYTASKKLESTNDKTVKPSLEEAYMNCTRVIDHNHNQGQEYHYPCKNGVFKPPTLPK